MIYRLRLYHYDIYYDYLYHVGRSTRAIQMIDLDEHVIAKKYCNSYQTIVIR